jgi:hypothetical protein
MFFEADYKNLAMGNKQFDNEYQNFPLPNASLRLGMRLLPLVKVLLLA